MNSIRQIVRSRKCKVCKTPFVAYRTTQQVCSPICAETHAKTTRERQERKELRNAREAIKPRQKWLQEAQQAVNKYVRARDRLEPCISCGRHHDGQWHAGHYRTTKSCPELRFDPMNIWKQCQPCNTHLSGNILEYRKNLILKIGLEKVEWLEGPHPARHYTIEDLREIKTRYTKLAKELDHGTPQ